MTILQIPEVVDHNPADAKLRVTARMLGFHLVEIGEELGLLRLDRITAMIPYADGGTIIILEGGANLRSSLPLSAVIDAVIEAHGGDDRELLRRALTEEVGGPAADSRSPDHPIASALCRALEPFASFADPLRRVEGTLSITRGSGMARRQLTMADCYAAADALAAASHALSPVSEDSNDA